MKEYSGKASIKKNAFMNMLLTASSMLIPLITFPYVSRVLQPERLGRVSFITSVVSYFLMFSELGIPTYGIRECARLREDKKALGKTVSELFIINLIMSFISLAAYIVCIYNVPRFSGDKRLCIIAGSAIIFNCLGMEWLYKGLEEYSYITVRSLLFKLISLVFIFAAVKVPGDYRLYCAATVISNYGSYILNFFRTGKITGGLSFKGLEIKKHIKPVLVFFSMSVATGIYLSLDTAMLGFMKGDAETGIYSAAVKIKLVLTAFVTSLGAVLFPRSAYLVKKGEYKEFADLSRRAMGMVVTAALPMAVFFMLFADEGIALLSGAEYADAVLPMRIIMPTLVLIGMSNITGIQLLMSIGREKTVLFSEIAGAFTDIIFNAILIPKYGAAGAAAGTLAAEFIVWLWQYVAVKLLPKKEYRGVYENIRPLLLTAALLVSVLGGWGFKLTGFSQIPRLIIGVAVFFGLYIAVLYAGGDRAVREITDIIKKYLKSE